MNGFIYILTEGLLPRQPQGRCRDGECQAGKAVQQRSSFSSHSTKQQTTGSHAHSVRGWLGHQKTVTEGLGVTVKQGATTIHEGNAAYKASTSSLTMKMIALAATHALRCGVASRRDSQTTLCNHSDRINQLVTKSDKWNGKPRLAC